MGEVMTFSVKAQVYLLDQASQSWSQHTFSVVPISLYTDQNTGRTRIIAMENSEPKVNSLMLPEMVFHRPSETFGQWLDPTANELYGLNFTSKADAENFEKTFSDAVAQSFASDDGMTELNAALESVAVSVESSLGGGGSSAEDEKLRKEIADLQRQIAEKDAEIQKKVNEAASKNNSAQAGVNAKIDTLNAQIKTVTTESENLKTQLNSLKNQASSSDSYEGKIKVAQADIAKLQAALKTSTANAEAWQKQLAAYQKENQDLKGKLQKLIDLQKGFASVLS